MWKRWAGRGVRMLNITRLKWFLALGALVFLFSYLYNGGPLKPKEESLGPYVAQLLSARHVESELPAQKRARDLWEKRELKAAAENALGIELRDASGLSSGDPRLVFASLSHLAGLGEVIWVDQWTNFPIRLPPTELPGHMALPRQEIVNALLAAIAESGGCLIKAGENRHLVAKTSQKANFEAAIRSLGWLDGVPPPWKVKRKAPPPRKPETVL